MDLTKIENPDFLNKLNIEQLEDLSDEIRTFLIENLAQTGGHLSSNLGVVELTVAMHYVFNSPKDKFIYDVGHQSYVHKILTGRAKDFQNLRMTNGLSGFQKRKESIHDPWEAGHSSTALSAAVGMAIARDLDHENFDVLAVVGDGAMLGGASLEALNHLGVIPNKTILVLNDNQMSIGKRIGNVSNFLTDIRLSHTYNHFKKDYRLALIRNKAGKSVYNFTHRVKEKIKHSLISNTVFDDFGVKYIGPIDGHNIKELTKALKVAQESKESVVVHVLTTKGKGYEHALNDITGKWHGIGRFDVKSGQSKDISDPNLVSWSLHVSNYIHTLMEDDQDIVAITPAMIAGSKMQKLFDDFPNRCFDVGIAEQHALTFTGGLSVQGKKPFISVYSSFIQRAYDQINHDIARMNLPSFICIDRCGIVGNDGPTHHGVFDIGIFYPIPNLVIFAPSNGQEAIDYIDYAFKNFDRPYMMRIPRNDIPKMTTQKPNQLEFGKWSIPYKNKEAKVNVITYGDNVGKLMEQCQKDNLSVNIINARFIKPIDEALLHDVGKMNLPVLVYETDLKKGGLNQQISSFYHLHKINAELYCVGIDDHYSIQGSIQDIYDHEKISVEDVTKKIMEIIDGKRKN